jgi:hypothetical protein
VILQISGDQPGLPKALSRWSIRFRAGPRGLRGGETIDEFLAGFPTVEREQGIGLSTLARTNCSPLSAVEIFAR